MKALALALLFSCSRPIEARTADAVGCEVTSITGHEYDPEAGPGFDVRPHGEEHWKATCSSGKRFFCLRKLEDLDDEAITCHPLAR